MNESVRAAEADAVNRSAGIQASVTSLLFETLGMYRQGEEATETEKMAAAGDLLAKVMTAIETQFDKGKANYALAHFMARQTMKDREHLYGARVDVAKSEPVETPAEMVARRQAPQDIMGFTVVPDPTLPPNTMAFSINGQLGEVVMLVDPMDGQE